MGGKVEHVFQKIQQRIKKEKRKRIKTKVENESGRINVCIPERKQKKENNQGSS
jgi:hypothetical protein